MAGRHCSAVASGLRPRAKPASAEVRALRGPPLAPEHELEHRPPTVGPQRLLGPGVALGRRDEPVAVRHHVVARQLAHVVTEGHAELLHLVGTLYAHLALGVHAEWSAFEARRPELRHVDAFRAAHRDFARRVAARCLLRPSLAPVLRALRLMLGLALQLRAQLQPEHGTQPAAPSHAAVARTAHRWRVELGQGVSFVLRALQAAAATGDEPQLLELSEQLDFNSYYAAGRSAG